MAMKSKTLNMTEGNPVRLLLIFSVPMLIGNIFQQVYNLVDSIIVGRFVGANALASVGATNSVTFLFFSICMGISNGGGIITSQYFGSGNEDKVKRAIANTAYIVLAISFLVGIGAFAATSRVLHLMGTPEEIIGDAILYMHMYCLGVPLIAIYNYASSMLRALGDSKTPLYFLIFSCFLNTGLDVWMVYKLHLGVFGAALATIISQLIAGAGCLYYAIRSNPYFKLEKDHFKLEKDIIWSSVRLGIPLSLQYSMIAISCMALQRVVNSFGSAVVAAFTATSRIEQLVHQPYGSLGMALATYAGQNLGAKRLDRVKSGYRKSIVIAAVFSLSMLLLMLLGSNFIVRLFVNDPKVIQLGAMAIKITCWFYFFLGLIYVTRGILNGVGDAMFAFINGSVEVVGRIFFPICLTMIPMIGVWGIWWSAGLTWLVSAFFCVLRYFSWRKHNLL